MNALEGVKRGDTVVVSRGESATIERAEVTAAGPKWITTAFHRFRLSDGYAERRIGTGTRAYTLAQWDASERRRVCDAGLDRALSNLAHRRRHLTLADIQGLTDNIVDALDRVQKDPP